MQQTSGNNISNDKRTQPRNRWNGKALILFAADMLIVTSAYFLALWMRFDGRYSMIPEEYLNAWMVFAPAYCAFCAVTFYFLRLYRSVWRFASYNELVRIILSSLITFAFHTVFITEVIQRMPLSYYILGAVFQFIFMMIVRFSYRFAIMVRRRAFADKKTARIMLIGAGNAGQSIIRDIARSKEITDWICCIIDDDPGKWGKYIDGIPIVGGRDSILYASRKYGADKIYMAIPSASVTDRQEILDICKDSGCELKILPATYQIILGEVSVQKMVRVSVEDLLGREPVKTEMKEVFELIEGKRILITGAGGSIGSELCRQVAAHSPDRLILVDVYENNAFDIEYELKEKYPQLELVTIIASVRDSRRMNQIFMEHRPQVVYHAAAHKHVPLMEQNPNEAVKNNTIGTYKTAYAAMMNGCERFVLISTDKAVRPVNVMGASKALCEMVIRCFDEKVKQGRAVEIPRFFTHAKTGAEYEDFNFDNVKTEFVAVRFGNVLGSNGSVIPTFRKQIEKGGPVTVTHPDIIRYFMTIPEAVSLVLLAGAYAGGGEVFVLDMGSPVRIDDLARNMIKLEGYRPDKDIKIVYTGLRPGEKLYEEKLMEEEGLRKTENELIHIGSPPPINTDKFLSDLQVLMKKAYDNSSDIRDILKELVPTYHKGNM